MMPPIECYKNDRRGGNADLVSPNELRRSITNGVLSRNDWKTFEMTADVFGKLTDRGITTRRFLAHRHENDVVEIAAKRFGIWGLDFGTSIAPGDGGAGTRRFLLGDGARNFIGSATCDPIRTLAREQLVKNHAQTVDITRGADVFAAHLFGAGVLWRHHALEGESLADALSAFGIEQFRDAKIEQLWFAFRGHADIRRLDVAVNDQMLMRVGDGRANFAEKFESLVHGQPRAHCNIDPAVRPRHIPWRKMEFHPWSRRCRKAARYLDDSGWREDALHVGSGEECRPRSMPRRTNLSATLRFSCRSCAR